MAAMLQDTHVGPDQRGNGLLQRRCGLLEMGRLFAKGLGHYSVARQFIAVTLDQDHGVQGAPVNVVQRAFDGAAGAIRRVHDLHDALDIHHRLPSAAEEAAALSAPASRISTTLPRPEIVAPWYQL